MTETNVNEINALLVQGFKAAKEGDREAAYTVFCDVVNRDSNNELGWLYRAASTDDLSEAYVCLQRVLSINPANSKAQRGLERIKAKMEEEAATAVATPATESGAEENPPVSEPEVSSNPPIASGEGAGEQEVVSGFGFAKPVEEAASKTETDEDLSGFGSIPAMDQTRKGPVQFPPYNTSSNGPAIPPFGAPPPVRDDDDINVAGMFNNAATTPRYMGAVQIPQDAYPAETGDGAIPTYAPPPGEDVAAVPLMPEEMDYSALRAEKPGKGRRKKSRVEDQPLQQFGGGTLTNTDLDNTGIFRQGKMRRNLLIVLLGLVALVLILLLANLIKNNQTVVENGNVTADVAATATTNITSTAVVANPTTAAVVATTAAPATTTAAAATTTRAATTAATGATTAAVTTAAVPATTTAAPATTTAAPATTTAAPTPVVAPVTTEAAPTAPRPLVYTIKSGDTLTRLAQANGTTIEAIVAANRDPAALGSKTPLITGSAPNWGIYANTRIVIPVQKPDFRGRAIIVKDGETLDALAARYNVKADEVLKLSGYASAADIKVGDALLLP